MDRNSKCINFRECGNLIYKSDSEFRRFEELYETVDNFVPPKRCSDCRGKAKVYYAERKLNEQKGGGYEDDVQKFPHNSRDYKNKKGNRYGY